MSADFIIIGGGIAGLSVAARLSELGKVVLLEAEDQPGYHTSGRSAATYEENYGAPPVVALNQASRAYLTDSGVTSPRGAMLVAQASEAEHFEADRASMQFVPISLDDALKLIPILNPDVVRHAAFHDSALDLDTHEMMQGFMRAARANGAEFHMKSRVDRIMRQDGGGWTVRAGGREWQGRILVNASGSWVDQVARMAGVAPLGFTPLRRSMARIPAPAGHDVSRWPMMFGPGENWYAKPDAGQLLVSPAEEVLMEPHDAFADDMTLAEGLARYEAVVTEPVTRLTSNWGGLRTFAPDRVLVIGFDAAAPDFFWHAGQGGYGFQTSPAASLLAADIIGGRQSELDAATVAALSPARFG